MISVHLLIIPTLHDLPPATHNYDPTPNMIYTPHDSCVDQRLDKTFFQSSSKVPDDDVLYPSCMQDKTPDFPTSCQDEAFS
ncbi:hypothetical protein DPMN_076637 [Dreissena polymorpha]|uniref:Uncharacterized protein n=1 Tax=Dreissena polymorpha TaxID=45954 RepID=A0A9D3YJ13_DREPO|nr:hypothetical protein DPMN_076637 [Dreissena polymorpha]